MEDTAMDVIGPRPAVDPAYERAVTAAKAAYARAYEAGLESDVASCAGWFGWHAALKAAEPLLPRPGDQDAAAIRQAAVGPVLELHQPCHDGEDATCTPQHRMEPALCRHCVGEPWPCPTGRAVGVTSRERR